MKPWMKELKVNIEKKRQILFSKDSACLSSIQMKLQEASHEQVIAWAMIALAQPLDYLVEHYPNDPRPMEAVILTTKWHRKQIKMPPAKQAILALHGMAKSLDDPTARAYCHAVGHACATVHVATHAMGLPIYELTGLVIEYGVENCEHVIEEKIQRYHQSINDILIKSIDTVSSV